MKMRTATFAVAALLASQALAAPVQWPASQGGNDHYYDWVPGYLTWSDARTAAESSIFLSTPGHLATIVTPAENAFFQSHFSQSTGPTLIGWLGGYQDPASPDYSEPAGGWRWVTGEPWTFTKWWTDKNLPDDFNGQQDYLRTQPVGPDIFWDDIENDPNPYYIGGYFVEYPVPEPALAVPMLLASSLYLTRRRRPNQ
jgi:hypothetical protein